MNRVFMTGKVDSEPKTRAAGDKTVGDFRLDTGKGWFTITAWEDLAKNLPTAGSQVFVEGRLSTRSYENKEGQKVYVTEVVASAIEVLGGAGAAAGDDLGF